MSIVVFTDFTAHVTYVDTAPVDNDYFWCSQEQQNDTIPH